MTNRKALLFLAAAALAISGLAQGASAADAPPTKLSDADATKFSQCMGMTNEQVSHDNGCLAVMQKINVSQSDMVKMKGCEAQTSNSHADVEHDRDCEQMIKKHPELVQGLGRDGK